MNRRVAMPNSSHNHALLVSKNVYTRPDMYNGAKVSKIAPCREVLGKLRARKGTTDIMSKEHLYKVVFMSQGQVYEVYAKSVGQGDMFGFIQVEELVFGERTTVVVDPSEERIKSEFANVRKTFLPMHSILRIDEVDKQGVSKVSKLEGGNVAQFPMPVYTPGDKG